MNNRLDFKDLDMIRAIGRHGSATLAAREMHVSQPAVSQRLNKVQHDLNLELFERRSGRLHPTAAGKRLGEAAERIFAELRQADRDIQDQLLIRRNQLRITTECYTCYRWLPFLISNLYAQHENLTVDVVPEATAQPLRAIEEDLVDIAIVSSSEPAKHSGAMKLFEDEMFAVMHESHPLAKKAFLSAATLAAETLVLYSGDNHPIVDYVLTPAQEAPTRIIEVQITEAIVELARADQGIAILAGWAFDDIENKQNLTAVRIRRQGFRRTWSAVINTRCPRHLEDAFAMAASHIGRLMRERQWRRIAEAKRAVSQP